MQLRPAFAILFALVAVSLESHAASPNSSINATPSSVAIVELFTSEGMFKLPVGRLPPPADQSEADERGTAHRRYQ